MPEGKITKRSVDALACPTGKDRIFLWDTDTSGFGVAAFPSGKKVYVAQYRHEGRSRRLSLGMHGRLTPEQARSEAKKALGDVEKGVDIIAQRKIARGLPTFTELAEEWLRTHVSTKRKSRTRSGYETLLRKHILPEIGRLRVNEIRRLHISKLHGKLSGTPGAANRALAVVSAVWNWAARQHEDLGLGPSPAKGIERNREQGKERFLTTEELARIGEALEAAETVGLIWNVDETKARAKHAPAPENRRRKLDPFAIAAVRLLMFTGARLREVLHARWDWVDAERGLLNVPDSKTGKKAILLPAPALAVLAELPRVDRNPHIIAGEEWDENGLGKPRYDLKLPWRAITIAAGLEGLRIHDLRHSFASVGAGASLGLPIIGKLLGHRQPSTTSRYAHLADDPLRRAADQISATIAAAMKRKPSADIVPMRKPAS